MRQNYALIKIISYWHRCHYHRLLQTYDWRILVHMITTVIKLVTADDRVNHSVAGAGTGAFSAVEWRSLVTSSVLHIEQAHTQSHMHTYTEIQINHSFNQCL